MQVERKEMVWKGEGKGKEIGRNWKTGDYTDKEKCGERMGR